MRGGWDAANVGAADGAAIEAVAADDVVASSVDDRRAIVAEIRTGSCRVMCFGRYSE